MALFTLSEQARNPKIVKPGFDPHKYNDIVFVYFRMHEHIEKEAEHLIQVVREELDRNQIKYTEVTARNFNYKQRGLAHIEVNMGQARSKGARAITPEEAAILDSEVEIDPEMFSEVMDEEETLPHHEPSHPKDKTKIMKVMKEAPGVLSVESMAGISFARDVPVEEQDAHNKATAKTFFRQRAVRKSMAKNQAHKESLHTYRKPAYYKGRSAPVVSEEL